MSQPKRNFPGKNKAHPTHHSKVPKDNKEKALQVIPVPLPCTYCRTSGADFQCCVCGTLYCGVVCQLHDWLHHKNNQCIPRLVKASPVFVSPEFWIEQEALANQSHSNNMPTTVSSRPSTPKPTFQTNVTVAPSVVSIPMIPTQVIASKSAHPTAKSQSQNSTVPLANANFSMPPPGMRPKLEIPVATVPKPSQVTHNKIGENLAVAADPAATNALRKENTMKHIVDVINATEHARLETSILSAIVDNSMPKPDPVVQTTTTTVHTQKRFMRPGPFPAKGRKVKISHVADNKLFIYCIGPEPNGMPNQYLLFMKRSLEAARETDQFIKAPPAKGDMVFAPLDGEYYRAVVMSNEASNVSVIFPDLGNKETIEWTKLKLIKNSDIKYAHCLTYEVQIDHVPVFTPPMYDFLSALVENDELEIINVTKIAGMATHVKTIDLRHTHELYKLSDKLLERGKVTNVPVTANTEMQTLQAPNLGSETPDRKEKPDEQNDQIKPERFTLAEQESKVEKAVQALALDLIKEATEQNDQADTDPPVKEDKLSPRPKPTDAKEQNDKANIELEIQTVHELIDNETNDQRSNLVENMSPSSQQDKYTPVLAEELKDPTVSSGKGVFLYVVNTSKLEESNTISVVRNSLSAQFDEIKQECNRHATEDSSSYQPRQLGEACLIKHGNSWWRALRISLVRDHYLLLDSNQICTLSEKSDVRKYPEKLSRQLFVEDCIVDNPRMLKFAMSGYDDKTNALPGKILIADVTQENGVLHALIVDLVL